MGIYAFCAFFMSDLWTQSVQWWVWFFDSGQTIRTYPPNFIHNVLMEPIGYVRNVCSHNLPYASPRMICIPAIWMNISHEISLNMTCLTTFAKFVFSPQDLFTIFSFHVVESDNKKGSSYVIHAQFCLKIKQTCFFSSQNRVGSRTPGGLRKFPILYIYTHIYIYILLGGYGCNWSRNQFVSEAVF